LEKIVTNFKRNVIQNIPKIYLEDACYIQPRFYDYVNHISTSEISEIRLYHSIKNLLINLSKEYTIQIYVYNVDKIDKKSEKLLRFLCSTTYIHVSYINNFKENEIKNV